MKTLKEILIEENTCRAENGMFGMIACKEEVERRHNDGESYYTLLEEYVDRANHDNFFNNRMVLACWELINE